MAVSYVRSYRLQQSFLCVGGGKESKDENLFSSLSAGFSFMIPAPLVMYLEPGTKEEIVFYFYFLKRESIGATRSRWNVIIHLQVGSIGDWQVPLIYCGSALPAQWRPKDGDIHHNTPTPASTHPRLI